MAANNKRGDYRTFSVDGWSGIDKMMHFTHAVGRVSNGRGSAILLSLLDGRGNIMEGNAANMSAWRRVRPSVQRSARLAAADSIRLDHNAATGGALLNGEGNDVQLPALGVLLTTSHVLATKEEADGAAVVFMEQAVVGTAALMGRAPTPFQVRVRADYGFVTSATDPPQRREATQPSEVGGGDSRSPTDVDTDVATDGGDVDDCQTIGFTLTYCSVYPSPDSPAVGMAAPGPETSFLSRLGGGRWSRSVQRSKDASVSRTPSVAAASGVAGDNLTMVAPLPLPLLLSSIPPVAVGDTHLMVTHVDGAVRAYRVQRVSFVHDGYCEYDSSRLGGETCSGGPVFNTRGDFVGMQHQQDVRSICIFTRSISMSLFQSNLLGFCRTPISSWNVKRLIEAATSVMRGSDSERMSLASRQSSLSESEYRSTTTMTDGDSSQFPSHSDSVGRSNSLVLNRPHGQKVEVADFNDILLRRRRQEENQLPISQRLASYEEVFAEFFSDFESLIRMLHCFSYSPAMVEVILDRMIQTQYAKAMGQLPAAYGVGIILEIIDAYPHEESIVTAALTTLSRLCVYNRNLTVFLQVDGIVTVLEVMKEYVHQPTLLQWGTYILLHTTQPSLTTAAESVATILCCNGAQLLVSMLRLHGNSSTRFATLVQQHLVSWLYQIVANIVRVDRSSMTLLFHENFLGLLLQRWGEYHVGHPLTICLVSVFCEIALCFADIETVPPVAALTSSATATAHQLNFSFLLRMMYEDKDFLIYHTLLSRCDAALAEKNSSTPFRAEMEEALTTHLEVLRLLLSWGVVPSLARRQWLQRSCQEVMAVLPDYSVASQKAAALSAMAAALPSQFVEGSLADSDVVSCIPCCSAATAG